MKITNSNFIQTPFPNKQTNILDKDQMKQLIALGNHLKQSSANTKLANQVNQNYEKNGLDIYA